MARLAFDSDIRGPRDLSLLPLFRCPGLSWHKEFRGELFAVGSQAHFAREFTRELRQLVVPSVQDGFRTHVGMPCPLVEGEDGDGGWRPEDGRRGGRREGG